MATHIAPLTDAAWTPKDALLTDTIANEVYSSHYSDGLKQSSIRTSTTVRAREKFAPT